ncbi:DUF2478 domain-containing protein [Roseicyclus sp.]|uniref:DUF2478 domain-containing protein n=1 Tax=Roseicyclus sp. TaxID=1914329 RepID=UPI003F9F5B73
MQIAYTMAPGRGDTDLLLQGLADWAAAAGHRAAGTVQINSARPDDGPCDMDVKVLPEGPVLRISQDLGAAARGCRLDPRALEEAVGLVEAGLARADCLIVNKFGKHEAEGRGFRTAIAEAVSRGLPVLVGVNALNLPAFLTFCGGEAVMLPPRPRDLRDWLDEALSAAALTA